ncbi:RNA polymerase sigma factor [Clostridium sp. AM58-1XD]|uniref:RNA polymerase sigma factor n=1 Tax=Clostridium sp. AM58-1XD TaxID=2292307 RepID=UPI000E473C17|nr:RNA polymerase sigma factor [Clostridium sp. AM58-1XD]RGY96839.1 RNA polymerase sigma factor [Clostridium sp. AM58-1XD]
MTDNEFDKNIGLIRQGNQEGLKAIYEAYLPAVYSSVLAVLHNEQSAQDVTADFFIRLWEIAGQYRQGGKHKAWMMTVAHNMAVDHLRKYRHEELVEQVSDLPESRTAAISEEDRVCSELTLKQALETLEEEERQIVNLKIMGELTLKEISQIMKKPLGTVAWKYRVALNKLKRCRYE